jgi:hypothetical protein
MDFSKKKSAEDNGLKACCSLRFEFLKALSMASLAWGCTDLTAAKALWVIYPSDQHLAS